MSEQVVEPSVAQAVPETPATEPVVQSEEIAPILEAETNNDQVITEDLETKQEEPQEDLIEYTFDDTGVTVELREISPIVIEMMQAFDIPDEPAPPTRTVKEGGRVIEGEPDFDNDNYQKELSRWRRNVNRKTIVSTKEMLHYVAAVSWAGEPPGSWWREREEFIKSRGHGRMLYLQEQMRGDSSYQNFLNAAMRRESDDEEDVDNNSDENDPILTVI